MILYVNGDSHSAGAEAVNSYSFACDDSLYWNMGREPHPDNLRVSYGCELANMLGAILECQAESASSNDRIIRTTYDALEIFKPDLVIIGWSTWEREEWWHEGTQQYWQVNAGGIGHDWPSEIKEQYRNYIVNLNYDHAVRHAHEKIHLLHRNLELAQIPHIFFNTWEPFSNLPQFDWGHSYINPYDADSTYYNWLQAHGYQTVNPDSYHFGPDAHRAWAEFLYQNYVMKLLTSNE